MWTEYIILNVLVLLRLTYQITNHAMIANNEG